MLTRTSGRLAPAALALCLSFAGPALALDPLLPPSGNFDVTHWKLTLPSGSEVQPWVLSSGVSAAAFFISGMGKNRSRG